MPLVFDADSMLDHECLLWKHHMDLKRGKLSDVEAKVMLNPH